MEDADFDDCGVSLVNHLDKLETNVCSKVEEAKKDLTRTLNFNDMQTRIRDKEHHAELQELIQDEVSRLATLNCASAKKQEQMLDMLTNLEDRLEQMLAEQKAHQEKEKRIDRQAEKEMRM